MKEIFEKILSVSYLKRCLLCLF